MRRYSLMHLLAGFGLGIATGLLLAWLGSPSGDASAATETAAAGDSAATPPFFNTAAGGAAPSGAATVLPSGETFESLRRQALADPAALRALMQRLERSEAGEERNLLKSVLGSIHLPEVQAFALRLAASSDPALRADGYEILQTHGIADPGVRAQLQRALSGESDPRALRLAIQALHYDAVPDGPAIVGGLQQLTRHADAGVRSSSLAQLSHWEKGPALEDWVHNGLADPAREVRQAAISAALNGETRSERLKTSLLQIAANRQEATDTRDIALNALEHYKLEPEEYVVYAQAREEIGRPGEARPAQ
jgi:hypothetical protein